jgi:hypothetical protein
MAGTTPTTAAPAARRGITAAPGRVKPLYVVIGAGGIGGLALYMRHRASKNAANNATPTTATADTTVTDDFTQLSNQIDQLQRDEQNEPLPSNNPTPTPNPKPKPKPKPRPPIHGGNPPGRVPLPPPPPAPTPNPNPTPRPVAQTHTYIVRHNDTLSGIAAHAGISLDELRRLNPVYWTNPKYQQGNMIWAGDRVVLPGAS